MRGNGLRSELAERFLPALKYPDFRNLWLSGLSASSAAWALIVARGWLVYQISGSSAWVGLTTFAAMIPLFLMPPVAGFLADRFERRRLLTFVYGVQFVQIGGLAILALSNLIEPWTLVVFAFVNGMARATRMPVTQALLPNVVPKERLLNAIALNAATLHGSRLVGAGLIAPLLATSGATPAFILCTGFYALAMLLTLRIRTTSTGEMDQAKSGVENFLMGVRYVYSHRLVWPLVVVVFLHCGLTMSFESLLPVLADKRLGGSDAGFSYLMMAVGAGALVGVLSLAMIQSPQTRGRLLLVTGLVSGLAPMGLAVSTSLTPALASAAAMGGSQAAFMALTATFLQAIVPDAIRGRVMSVYLLHIGGMMASVNLANGALADTIGAPVLLIAPGLIFVAVIAASSAKAALRQLYTRGAVTTAPAV
ncbi:MAG: MFS transporter [Dehalococcoidia bacterium]